MYAIMCSEDRMYYTGEWPEYWDIRGPFILTFGSRKEAWDHATKVVGIDERRIEIHFIHPLNIPKR